MFYLCSQICGLTIPGAGFEIKGRVGWEQAHGRWAEGREKAAFIGEALARNCAHAVHLRA